MSSPVTVKHRCFAAATAVVTARKCKHCNEDDPKEKIVTDLKHEHLYTVAEDNAHHARVTARVQCKTCRKFTDELCDLSIPEDAAA